MDGQLTGSRVPFLIPQARAALERAGGDVLEIGFGEGRAITQLAAAISDLPAVLHGVDALPAEVGIDHVMAEVDPHVEPPTAWYYLLGVLGAGPRRGGRMHFDHGQFGFVYSCSVFRFLPDKASVVEDACRVLRPGGVAVLDLDDKLYPPDHPHSRFAIRRDGGWVRTFDYLAERAGDGFSVSLLRDDRLSVRIEKHTDEPLDLRLRYDPVSSLHRDEMPVVDGKLIGGWRSVYDDGLREERLDRLLVVARRQLEHALRQCARPPLRPHP